ncbi:hypothetical protein Trisim1_008413 [Trichoderma cf. simile WF8]
MADVRALLRQQRAARRINHPYALYSDAGKLLCTLCRDHIRAESHWDAHLQSDKHKKRLSALNQSIIDDANAEVEDEDQEEDENNEAGGEEEDAEDHDALAAQKRKIDQLGPEEKDTDLDDEDEARRKRSRPATASEDDPNRNKKPLMPTQGVQVQIASRSSTPSQQPAVPKLATSLPSRQASNLATPASSSSMSISIQPQSSTASLSLSQQPAQPASQDQQQQVDEDEWAAFEADIAAQDYSDDAVISRPAMTAEEAAAAAAKDAAEEDAAQNPESRKSKADAEIEDEREEATRALEDEFEEMQELEARVQRLKEKREALMRKRSETLTQDQADDVQTAVKAVSDPQDEGKENVQTTGDSTKPEADDDDDDEDDEEDDWDGFRFRTGR